MNLAKTTLIVALFLGGALVVSAQRTSQPSAASTDNPANQTRTANPVQTRAASGAQALAPSGPDAEEIVEMSPFVVTDKDDDWMPTKGISAGRLATDLDDMAGEIDILTKEMLDDLGATDLEDMMEFDTGGEIDFGQFDTDWSASNYEGSNFNQGNTEGTLRGGRMTRVVNHEQIDWGFDTYNIARTATYYGANAILFGNGHPGGVKSSAKDTANLSRPTLRATFSMNEHGSLRYALDYGAVLIRHKLAVRAEMMYNKGGSYIEFNDSKRNAQYVALTWKPFPKTKIDINYEQGKSTNHQRNMKYPIDSLSAIYYGTSSGTTAGQSGSGFLYYGGRNDTPGSFAMGQSIQSIGAPDIRLGNNNLIPTEIYDYNDFSHAGPDSIRKLKYRDFGINLEHRLANNLYFSAYYRSSATEITSRFTSPRNPDPTLYIDPLPPSGSDDPYAGRIYAVTKWGYQKRDPRRDAFSALLAWTPNFGKWAGAHNISLGFDDRLVRNSTLSYGESSYALSNEGTATNVRVLRRVHYFDPNDKSTWHLGYWNPVAPYQDASGATRHVGWIPGNIDTAGGDAITRRNQQSYIAHIQSLWLNHRLVTSFGWRRDDTDTLTLEPTYLAPNGGYYLDYYGSEQIDPRRKERQESTAYSAVLFLNKSRSAALTFERAGNVGNLFTAPVLPYGEIPESASKATSTTYGIRFTLLEGRLRISANHYNVISKATYVRNNAFWFPITYRGGRANNQSFQIDIPMDDDTYVAETFTNNKQGALNEWADLLYNNNAITPEQYALYNKQLARSPDYNWAAIGNEGIGGLAITSETKGYSLNIRAQRIPFLPGLMLRLGYNYNITDKEDVANDADSWLNEFYDRAKALPENVLDAPYNLNLINGAPASNRPANGYTNEQIIDATYVRLNTILQDWIGTQMSGMGNTKHSFNILLRYNFPGTSFLRGFTVFGRYRWQDRAAATRLRTPVYDTDGKITDLKTEYLYRPEITSSGFGISYGLRRSLFGVRTRMNISLNVSDPLRDKYKPVPMRYATQTLGRVPGLGNVIALPVDSAGNPMKIVQFWRPNPLPPRTISLSATVRY